MSETEKAVMRQLAVLVRYISDLMVENSNLREEIRRWESEAVDSPSDCRCGNVDLYKLWNRVKVKNRG